MVLDVFWVVMCSGGFILGGGRWRWIVVNGRWWYRGL